MSKDSKNQDPSFGEFWNELIHKSDLAKENVSKVVSEFKNLGILQSKKMEQQPPSGSNFTQDRRINGGNYMREPFLPFVLAILLLLVSAIAFDLKQASFCEVGHAWDQKAGKCVRTIEFCADKKNSGYSLKDGSCNCIDGYFSKNNSCIKFPDCSTLGPEASRAEDNTCQCNNGFTLREGQCVSFLDFCNAGSGSLDKSQEPNTENPTCSCVEGSYWNNEMKSCESCAKLNNSAPDTRGVCPKKTSEGSSPKDFLKAIIH